MHALPSACRQVAGVHVQCSARHHSHRERRVCLSLSLSLSPLTSEGGEIKEEGGGSNKSDSVHSFVRSRKGPTAANTCIDFEDKSCTPNATRLSVIFHSASVKK